jgi:hypothetical protein
MVALPAHVAEFFEFETPTIDDPGARAPAAVMLELPRGWRTSDGSVFVPWPHGLDVLEEGGLA